MQLGSTWMQFTRLLKTESFMYLPTLFFTLSHYACNIHTSWQCDDVHYDVIERNISLCNRR